MSKINKQILIIEDDELSRLSLAHTLKEYGRVFEADSKAKALEIIKNVHFDLMFIDLDLEGELFGLSFLEEVKKIPSYKVVLSAREESEVIEKAYINGCSDFLSKPFTKEAITKIFLKLNQSSGELSDNLAKALLTEEPHYGKSFKTILESISSSLPIYLTGETGTGKTQLVQFIHKASQNKGSLIHLNCAEVSENLFESELFGHVKGSFTGAIKDKKGLMELADGGYLFLDEIATLSMRSQAKLLKALEEKVFYPVGSEKPVKSNFRLITATCEKLDKLVAEDLFREDLLFRIKGHDLALPALRERRKDLLSITNAFLAEGKRRVVLSAEAKKVISDYSWPGNLRELKKICDILSLNAEGIISGKTISNLLKNENTKEYTFDAEEVLRIGMQDYIQNVETEIVKHFFNANEGKVRKTLLDLKISNNTFYRIVSNLTEQGLK